MVTIPGSTKPQRVEENIDVGDFELDDDDFNLLWTLNKNEKCTWNPTNVIWVGLARHVWINISTYINNERLINQQIWLYYYKYISIISLI